MSHSRKTSKVSNRSNSVKEVYVLMGASSSTVLLTSGSWWRWGVFWAWSKFMSSFKSFFQVTQRTWGLCKNRRGERGMVNNRSLWEQWYRGSTTKFSHPSHWRLLKNMDELLNVPQTTGQEKPLMFLLFLLFRYWNSESREGKERRTNFKWIFSDPGVSFHPSTSYNIIVEVSLFFFFHMCQSIASSSIVPNTIVHFRVGPWAIDDPEDQCFYF